MTFTQTVGGLVGLIGVSAVLVPLFTFAQTYHYVSTEGDIEAVEAESASEALVTAPDIALHSGVAEDRGDLDENMDTAVTLAATGGANLWAYVDMTGTVETIVAPNPDVAISAAANRDPHSGVAIVIDGSILAENN